MRNPGKFSLKYMSNPIKGRQSNKENRDMNGRYEECEFDFHATVTP